MTPRLQNYRSNFHQGKYLPRARKEGAYSIYLANLFYQSQYINIYLATLPHNISYLLFAIFKYIEWIKASH